MSLLLHFLTWVLIPMSILSCNDAVKTTLPKPYEPKPYALKLPAHFGDKIQTAKDNPTTQAGVTLGRRLFYDKILSENRTISCASCHQQSKAFTDGKRFSPGFNGQFTSKNTMSIVNMLWNSAFFWDGRARTLEQQAAIPIENHIEMNLPMSEAVQRLQASNTYHSLFQAAFQTDAITPRQVVKALSQFMRTLISSDSKYDRYLKQETQLTPEEKLGMDLFFTHPDPKFKPPIRGANCGDCHVNVLTSGAIGGFEAFHNNGLDSDKDLKKGLEAVTKRRSDKGKFKAPSLRNIALTAPYMHDGRFNTLEEVLEHYNDHIKRSATLSSLIIAATNHTTTGKQIKLGLTPEEKKAVIAFLHTLTDQTFITNEAFSDPFGNGK